MKNQVHHTLLPLTAVMLILGLSLQVMLHFRQKSALQNITANATSVAATLYQTNLLAQIWSNKASGASAVKTTATTLDDQKLANALLKLRQFAATDATLLQQVQETEQRMMRSETIADSLQSLSGTIAKKNAQMLMLQTDQSVAATLQGMREKLQAIAQTQTVQYLSTQKRSEGVTMNSLAITMVAFIAFLYFLFQDFRLLRQQHQIESASDDEEMIEPNTDVDVKKSEASAFARGAYRRQLLLESLTGKSEKEPKIALPIKE